ncbi:MAG: response regulator, partial [Calditrichaeota bacterium]
MDNPIILVVDADPKNLQILQEGLEAAGFSVITASDGQEAWEKIHVEQPDLVLSEVSLPHLDGFQLLEKLKQDPTTSSIPIMFLTNRREIQDRVRSLRGGVKDYMIKPLHVKEVIARIRMILRRLERVKNDDAEPGKKLVGRLEEYGVADLIENFGVERKSGVLVVYNENNRSGEIYFRHGAVVHATLGTLNAEKAVYQMLPWRKGHFTMTFKEVHVPDSISVSNLGLLLHGFKRMEERERLFKMLPSPETTFVVTDTFKKILAKKELSSDAAKFLTLIDGRRDIMQIIDDSTYDDLKALERLVKLYQQGFIKPGHSRKPQPPEIKVARAGEAGSEVVERDEQELVQKDMKNGASGKIQVGRPEQEPKGRTPVVVSPPGFDKKDFGFDIHEPDEQEIQLGDTKEQNLPSPEKIELRQDQDETTEIEAMPSEASQKKEALASSENVPSVPLSEKKKKVNAKELMQLRAKVGENDRGGNNGQNNSRRAEPMIPEPLSDPQYRPGLDILEALAKISETDRPPQEIAKKAPLPLEFSKPDDKTIENAEPLPAEAKQVKPGSEEEFSPGEPEKQDLEETLPEAEAFPLRSYGTPPKAESIPGD